MVGNVQESTQNWYKQTLEEVAMLNKVLVYHLSKPILEQQISLLMINIKNNIIISIKISVIIIIKGNNLDCYN